MFSPSPEIIEVIGWFRPFFSGPTFAKACVLLYGVLLAPGCRTVCAALRASGQAHAGDWSRYHHIFNRASWSAWSLSRVLLQQVVARWVPAGCPVLLVFDETLERRSGPELTLRGRFYDAVRSSGRYISTSLGIRWLVVALLVQPTWSARQWALPVLVVPLRARPKAGHSPRRVRTLVEWSAFLVVRLRQWLPEREIVLVGDGSYAAVALVQRCQRLARPVTLVSRLRLDAALYDAPPVPVPGKRGPKPKKGARQVPLAERLRDPDAPWQTLTLAWYGGRERSIEYLTGTALWYRRGLTPVAIRWLLVRDPAGKRRPQAFFCSDVAVAPATLLGWYVARWNVEVTFQEVRRHLGFNTQRHWSPRAVERATPCLFGLFTLVVLLADRLHGAQVPTRQAAWYPKSEPTFADALAAVRYALWQPDQLRISALDPQMRLIPQPIFQALLEIACYSV
jgi:hypothetical protein